jgi:hypothetical protein
MRKTAGVMMAVLIASVGLAGTASATGGLYTLTLQSFQQQYSNTTNIQSCCQVLTSLASVWNQYTASYSSYTSNNNYGWFSTYSFGAISSWINQITSRYCPPVPEPTAALAFATGLLVLSRAMRRRSA